MSAWWLWLQMMAVAQAMSLRTGQPMSACVEGIDRLFMAYRDDPKTAVYTGSNEPLS